MNRLRCGQARCAQSLYRWDVIASPACPCGESHQTTRHIVEECPLTAFPGGLRRLHEAGPDAVECLSKLSMKLWRVFQTNNCSLNVISMSYRYSWTAERITLLSPCSGPLRPISVRTITGYNSWPICCGLRITRLLLKTTHATAESLIYQGILVYTAAAHSVTDSRIKSIVNILKNVYTEYCFFVPPPFLPK